MKQDVGELCVGGGVGFGPGGFGPGLGPGIGVGVGVGVGVVVFPPPVALPLDPLERNLIDVTVGAKHHFPPSCQLGSDSSAIGIHRRHPPTEPHRLAITKRAWAETY